MGLNESIKDYLSSQELVNDSINEITISLLVSTYEDYKEACKGIKENGLVQKHLTDNGFETIKPNPYVKIKIDCQIQILKMLQELGLTPKSKRLLQNKVESNDDNPIDKFFREFENRDD